MEVEKKEEQDIRERKNVIFFPSLEEIDYSKENPENWEVIRSFSKKNTDKSKYGLSKNGNNKNSGEKIKKLTYENVK
ncbi:MAG: hypothetical protein HFJ38_03925 [Bacilli bacterium]|nr:hypothetical protein [Bacilli bacterium]